MENKEDIAEPGVTPTADKPIIKAGFLMSIAGASILFGFGSMIALTKKKDPEMFAEGLLANPGVHESGAGLAMRAFRRATLYTVGTFTVGSIIIWKLSGAKTMKEFTSKIQNQMPRVPKHKPQGKSDFKTVRELVEYITNESASKSS